jgi:BirA family biotin operon repressor/biotin-[acetyl-CoA-carboxylase] ligase
MNLLDRLTEEKIRRSRRLEIIGKTIYCYDTTDSTNDVMWKMAEGRESEGIAVFAEEQNQGRGRQGAKWHCPKGNGLLFSVLLRPPQRFSDPTLVTQMSALSTAETLSELYDLNPRLKHPNDVLLDGMKVAGILTESRTMSKMRVLVVGIGLNVNTPADEFPAELRETATSLAISLDREKLDRAIIAGLILEKMDGYYRRFLRGENDLLMDKWSRYLLENRLEKENINL